MVYSCENMSVSVIRLRGKSFETIPKQNKPISVLENRLYVMNLHSVPFLIYHSNQILTLTEGFGISPLLKSF